jgi:hypothetical protein
MMPPSTPRAFKWQVINRACATHTAATSKPQVRYLVHTEDVREYFFIYSRPHALYVNLAVCRDYSSPAARALRQPRRAPRLLVSCRTRSTSTSPCVATTRLRPHVLYVNLVVHREYSSPLSRLQRSTSPTPRVRVPWHVARLVTRLIAPLVVDYSASRRLVVDYFTSAARPGASARRAARHAARRAARRRLLRARRRLLHLRRVARCLGTSRGSSRHSSSTTSPTPRVRVPRDVARPVTGFVVDYSVRCNFLLQPHWIYFSHVVCRDYLSHGNTGSTSSTPHATTTSSSSRIALTIHLD